MDFVRREDIRKNELPGRVLLPVQRGERPHGPPQPRGGVRGGAGL